MWKKPLAADPDSVLLALQALGAEVTGMNDVDDALARRRREIESRAVEPVIVAWDGRLNTHNLRLPPHSMPMLVLEDGGAEDWPPRQLPMGYHRLIVKSPDAEHHAL